MLSESRNLTWAEVRERVIRIASLLASLGVKAGDRLLLLADNSTEWIEVSYATQWIGAIVVPINLRWSSNEVQFAISDCMPAVIAVDDRGYGLLSCMSTSDRDRTPILWLGSERAPDGSIALDNTGPRLFADMVGGGSDVAGIYYTGGTTGRSKGVMLTHDNLVSHSIALAAELCLQDPPRHLHVAPMFHIADSLFIHLVSQLGGVHIVASRFDPTMCADAIRRHSADQTILVPTMIQMMLNDTVGIASLGGLKRLFYGASPMPQKLLGFLIEHHPKLELIQLYGQTEASPVLSVLLPKAHKVESDCVRSAGRALLGTRIKIVDIADCEVQRGSQGEIVARGPQVMAGYWERPEESQSILRNGWLHTGDAGYMDDYGYLYVTDRIKDMIISGGENVYSIEVEQVIYQMESVEQCCVVGLPDEKWGEIVHAIVLPKIGKNVTEADIYRHCQQQLTSFKCPRGVTIRNSPLPVSGAGKILKRELRDALRAALTSNVN